jgi:hypothetical protein
MVKERARVTKLLCSYKRIGKTYSRQVELSAYALSNVIYIPTLCIAKQCCGTVTIYYGSGSGSDF